MPIKMPPLVKKIIDQQLANRVGNGQRTAPRPMGQNTNNNRKPSGGCSTCGH